MKPLTPRIEHRGALQDLGRASIQIVHDLKNQLNGLKLYATFLRKRLEKGNGRNDELETINKLIAGLDRAAADLSTIVQYGREIEIKKQAGLDIQKVLRGICSDLGLTGMVSSQSNGEPLTGEFDAHKVTEALKWISIGTKKHFTSAQAKIIISVKREINDSGAAVIIRWSGAGSWDHDPFRSFAGPDEIRMSLAARIVEAHGGSAQTANDSLIVVLPLSESQNRVTAVSMKE
jgi:hypothetical protein